jgi:hypothetical protein
MKMKTKITIDKTFILSSSFDEYKYLLEYMPGYPGPNPSGNYNIPGISDYPFYAYFSTLVNNSTILEIGTFQGGSTIMLSHNQTNNVVSYDIGDFLLGTTSRKNIEFKIGNFMEDSSIDYDQIDLMVIDASHDGETEKKMFKFLEDNWKGGLLHLDDIHCNNNGNMTSFWENIDRDRHELFDISDIAHGQTQGSGLVNFNRVYNLNFI